MKSDIHIPKRFRYQNSVFLASETKIPTDSNLLSLVPSSGDIWIDVIWPSTLFLVTHVNWCTFAEVERKNIHAIELGYHLFIASRLPQQSLVESASYRSSKSIDGVLDEVIALDYFSLKVEGIMSTQAKTFNFTGTSETIQTMLQAWKIVNM